MHSASKYAGRVPISAKAMRDLLQHCLLMQRRPLPGGTCFFVAVDAADTVQGFFIGQLDRVYHIGVMMMAQDVFFHVSDRGRAADSVQLLDEYIGWAKATPKVLEINASWVDTIPGAERLPVLLERKGFTKTGEIWEMRLDVAEEEAAAA